MYEWQVFILLNPGYKGTISSSVISSKWFIFPFDSVSKTSFSFSGVSIQVSVLTCYWIISASSKFKHNHRINHRIEKTKERKIIVEQFQGRANCVLHFALCDARVSCVVRNHVSPGGRHLHYGKHVDRGVKTGPEHIVSLRCCYNEVINDLYALRLNDIRYAKPRGLFRDYSITHVCCGRCGIVARVTCVV